MEALLIDENTTELYFSEVEDPVPTENEILVQIKATALNRADIAQRMGSYPVPAGITPIPGLEMAGVVIAVGENVENIKIGDRVCSLLGGGGYAEKVAIPSEMAIPIPDYLSFEQAAGIPEVFLTAQLNLFKLGQMKESDTVLIHAGASGVGLAAIQIVKNFGAKSIVTASSAEKLQFCESVGADHTINYKEEDFAKRIHEITNGQGVQIILDFVGASYWEKNIESLSLDGKLILIGLLGGATVEKVNLGKILFKRLQVLATTLRSQSVEEKISLTNDFIQYTLPKFASGDIIPTVDSVYDWRDVMDAHKHMENNKNIGKIILTIS